MSSETATVMDSRSSGGVRPSIVELRQYVTAPGRRDELITLFEDVFVAEQERLGMVVLDQFRDLDDPDVFVWIRGFADMAVRKASTTVFYDGEVWGQHRAAANATLVDNDDVLLLRPVPPAPDYPTAGERPPTGSMIPDRLVALTVYSLKPDSEGEFAAFFAEEVAPVLTEAGAEILATYATEHSPNNYPRLAIREGESVFVWLARFVDVAAYEEHLGGLARSPYWSGEIAKAISERLVGQPEVRRLSPTARSRTR